MARLLEFNETFKHIQNHQHPVVFAWNEALNYLDFPVDSPWRIFGEKFAKSHPDLNYSPNAYHNQIHSAEAIFASSILVKEEFTKEHLHHYSPYLLFGMMCHDIAHNGKTNQYPYELEKKAVQSMKEHLNTPEFESLWKNNFEKNYGDFSHFQRRLTRLILGTEFKVGVEANVQDYEKNKNEPFNKINMLANEADIFVSVNEYFGNEKGMLLSEEQKMPALATEKGRMFFLEHLAKYKSDASKKLGVQEHINYQINMGNLTDKIKDIRQNSLIKNELNDNPKIK